MDAVLYWVAKALVVGLQSLPLTWVARLGRVGGALVFWLDGRHRRVAIRNLTSCFGTEKTANQIRGLAKENFRRIGENFASAAKTASMSLEQLRNHVEFVAPAEFISPLPGANRKIAAIGHFGNFELYARFGQFAPAYRCATTYRGLRQPGLNRLLQDLRERSGCAYFERRFEGAALKNFMHQDNVILGLLSDQHGGDGGLRMPFLGRDCSTSPAAAVFALRYNCTLVIGICYRIGLARWRIEAGPEIPTHLQGKARTPQAITADVNRAFEAAVRRDPANWFWVHNRWKPAPVRTQSEGQGSRPAEPLPARAMDRQPG